MFVNGQAIKDIYQVMGTIQNYLPEPSRKQIAARSKKNFSEYYAQVAHKLYHDYRNPKAALRLANDALKMHLNKKTFSSAIKIYLKNMIGYKKR